MPADASERGGKPRGRHPDKRLSVPAVNSAGPGFHSDGNGLYLAVDKSGARRWILRTLVHGRRRDIGLGGVATIRLAEARELARRLRKVARDGGDPIAERDRDKLRSPSFEEAARTVHGEHVAASARNGKHVAQWITTLETYAFPVIGAKPVHTVEQADVLRILAPIWTEKPETARRVKQRLKTVLDWASTAGHRSGVNPVDGVEKGLARQRDRTRHFAALSWRELPAFMKRLDDVGGMGALALRFAILTAARSGEVRGATWDEIDLAEAVWLVPAGRMKAGTAHRVPLSAQALAVLEAARVHSDLAMQVSAAREPALVFPAPRAKKPLSDMTLAAVLKRLAIEPEVATVHGFRSTFRDWAEETTSFPHEVKEAALAHTVKSKVEAAYRRTDLFDKRRDMMTAWGAFASSVS